MLHNRSGHLIFLACLDSFACSFLVCILQHREAELSMPQNGTAQSFLTYLCYFDCEAFQAWEGRKLIDCYRNFIKTRAIISSLIVLIAARCEMCCSLLLYKGVYTFVDVSCHAVQHSVPSVRLSIGLSGRWEMVGKILKDPGAYLDNIKCCRGPNLCK